MNGRKNRWKSRQTSRDGHDSHNRPSLIHREIELGVSILHVAARMPHRAVQERGPK
jgi:hypothetical protein